MPYKPNPRPRTWGTRFDSLPSSPPSPKSSDATETDVPLDGNLSQESSVDSPDKKRDERMPHDASVFVGSLPGNFDLAELGRLLSDHLAEHGEVKSVKVIRDSKGGVCAFVQCEDAASAANLIQTLRSIAPKPFLGRILRFEPARAFRTLLISYRSPMETMPANFNPTTDKTTPAKCIELNLPSAMRFQRKHRNAKYLTVLYNTDAIEADRRAKAEPDEQDSDPVLHMQPVFFNVDALKAICAHFGALEYFKGYKENGNDGNHEPATVAVFPSPHNAPRKPSMDRGCYEVKWAHRDDCVSALMTLRRVPHLTVTWAHSPPSYVGYDRDNAHHGRLSFANIAPYPMFVQRRIAIASGSGHSRAPSINENTIITDAQLHTSLAPAIGTQQWQMMAQPPPQDSTSTSTHVDCASNQVATRFEDFPPLVDHKNEHRSDMSGVWSKQKLTFKQESNEAFLDGASSESLSFDATSRGDVFDNLSSAQSFTADLDSGRLMRPEGEQGSESNETPALDRSPATPKTPGSIFPPTPITYLGERRSFFSKDDDENNKLVLQQETPGERALDPTTLFVGGLEMYGPGAWDEAKVESFFQRFGGLESVKVIRPSGGKAAFAFVKFDNTESPARAVQEEHNRVFEGRAMRVQFRDCNPPRGAWRPGRGGRGRYFNHHHISYHRQDSSQSKEKSDSDHDSPPSFSNDAYTRPHEDVKEYSEYITASPPNGAFVAAPSELLNVDINQAQATEPGQAVSPDPNLGDTSQDPQRYREWYEIGDSHAASTNASPPPVPFLGAENPVGVPHALPPGGYYPPWLQSYPHMQYPVPYAPSYPMYTLPNGQPHRHTSSGGSDSGGTLPPSPGAWASVGYGYLPYPGYHSRVPSGDHSSLQMQPHAQGQAPVMPTGFFQHEQGTLIAVYTPEAIDQYMSNRQAGQRPSSQSRPPTGPPAAMPASAPLPPPAPPMWPHYPPPPFPISNQVAPRSGQPPGQFQVPVVPLGVPVPNWTPASHSTGPFPATRPYQIIPPSMTMPITNGPSFRTHHDVVGHGNVNKRPGGRRDHFNGHRNPHGRHTPNRNPRAILYTENTGRIDHLNGGEWNQWEARRDVPKAFIS